MCPDRVPLRTISGPLPALTKTASRSSDRPRKSEVTGMSSAPASRSRVERLGEVCAFSILESIPLEMPVRSASWPTLRPISRRRARTWLAMTWPSWPSASTAPALSMATGFGRTRRASPWRAPWRAAVARRRRTPGPAALGRGGREVPAARVFLAGCGPASGHDGSLYAPGERARRRCGRRWGGTRARRFSASGPRPRRGAG